ncbi:hypothetical protein BH18ACT7_BH18ACT7_08330 [soil metagenome]
MTEPAARREGGAGLGRCVAAEALGTGFLVAAVVGSGIAATRLSPGQPGMQLLVNSVVTGAALVALILALQPVSAAFNPVVTLLERAFGTISTARAATLIGGQLAGGLLGAVAANLMFDRAPVSIATTGRGSGGQWLAEVVATLGLMLIIFGAARTGGASRIAYAVGAYITAAYWFTSSTSFANPAVTVARMSSDTFAGIAPSSVPMFILMQLVGGLVAYVLIRLFYSDSPGLVAELTEGRAVDHKPTVLFVCVHNAGRSQMAAGYLAHLAGAAVEVRSAGSEPAEQINPTAVAVMAEVGIDITRGTPKLLSTDTVRSADVVITMGCGDTCPVFPGRWYENWKLDDPAGQPIDAVRIIRDDIRGRVEALIAELGHRMTKESTSKEGTTKDDRTAHEAG